MGSMVVVAVQRVLSHVPDLLQGLEHIAVQHLGSIGLFESLHIGVLRRLARLDVVQGNGGGELINALIGGFISQQEAA